MRPGATVRWPQVVPRDPKARRATWPAHLVHLEDLEARPWPLPPALGGAPLSSPASGDTLPQPSTERGTP